MDKHIPYIAFEGEMARAERQVKRLWILCIILVVLLVSSNALWIWYESQFEVVDTTTVTQELDASDGGDAVINDGVHIKDGESETDGN